MLRWGFLLYAFRALLCFYEFVGLEECALCVVDFNEVHACGKLADVYAACVADGMDKLFAVHALDDDFYG